MPRALLEAVIARAGVSGFKMIFRKRVMPFPGGRIGIASASGSGTSVALDCPNLKIRMHRSDQ
ncbi:ATP-binding protein [Paraburkholderia sp. Ac-20336]|uniref:ATP-binding protein n=1 Tax=Paraburkholderia sp. Ac-20336 TaxID=2703886 RepID=UPI0019807F0F|nr:ATP-binding protein [Paraburkholderia sp. Ac-20336]MBN3802319.1 ATP-binding protein [Paraburkholderia sp. Ac-20336]